jgi:hypothetical protein
VGVREEDEGGGGEVCGVERREGIDGKGRVYGNICNAVWNCEFGRFQSE